MILLGERGWKTAVKLYEISEHFNDWIQRCGQKHQKCAQNVCFFIFFKNWPLSSLYPYCTLISVSVISKDGQTGGPTDQRTRLITSNKLTFLLNFDLVPTKRLILQTRQIVMTLLYVSGWSMCQTLTGFKYVRPVQIC